MSSRADTADHRAAVAEDAMRAAVARTAEVARTRADRHRERDRLVE
ncbi:MAG: hypothetical protein M3066_07815 [Actinomycetota bacterium]|nr:hypothetical protein [Actinomycetota bacterium]